MTTMSAAEDYALARRHAAWRWAGAPLLATGVGMLVWAVADMGNGGSWLTLGLSALGTGLALASFGANHDTAMALALRARTGGVAPEGAIARELSEELERDRSATMALQPASRIALAMPVVAVAVQAFVALRLVA